MRLTSLENSITVGLICRDSLFSQAADGLLVGGYPDLIRLVESERVARIGSFRTKSDMELSAQDFLYHDVSMKYAEHLHKK